MNQYYPLDSTETLRELFWLEEEKIPEFFKLKKENHFLRQKVRDKQRRVEELEYDLHLKKIAVQKINEKNLEKKMQIKAEEEVLKFPVE